MTEQTWPTLLSSLLAGESLTSEQTAWAMAEVMAGEATPVQVAGFAVALRAKGETPAEFTGLVQTMLANATPLEVPPGLLVDTCGTGGDRAHTVNISTMAALVVAGAGYVVAKHGNRAASSSCGSADVLEALGVVVDLPSPAVGECLSSAGIAFCFAPVFHPALRHAGTARRELGVATFFNFLGPLTNPARPLAQAVGVADPRMAPVMAQILADRGASALVFRGDDGLDELTTSSTSRVWWVRDGEIVETSLDPTVLGLAEVPAGALVGGDATHNARVVRELLAGESGPVRDSVVLNAAAAIVAAEDASGAERGTSLDVRLAAAMERAGASIDTGAAAEALKRWTSTSQALRTG